VAPSPAPPLQLNMSGNLTAVLDYIVVGPYESERPKQVPCQAKPETRTMPTNQKPKLQPQANALQLPVPEQELPRERLPSLPTPMKTNTPSINLSVSA